MSTSQFPCPACGRQLELPADSAGRLAQCPACQATFRAGDEPQPSSPEPISTSSGSDADSHPFASPLESGMAAPAAVNPYEPSYHSEPALTMGEIEIVPRTIEEVFSPTLTIFGARLGHLILAFLLSVVAGFVGFGGGMAALIAIGEEAGDTALAIAFLLSLPFGIFFGCYLSVGLARNAIAVARNQPSPIQEMLPPLHTVFRFMVGGMIMCVIVAAAIGITFGFLAVLTRIVGNQAIAASLIVTSIFGGSALSLVAYWLLWPWVFIVSDGKATALGALRSAWALTMHNKLTSLLLVVIAFVLSTAGASACYVGLIVTQPLTNLMFAVAYLLMTNQVISTGRESRDYTTEPGLW